MVWLILILFMITIYLIITNKVINVNIQQKSNDTGAPSPATDKSIKVEKFFQEDDKDKVYTSF